MLWTEQSQEGFEMPSLFDGTDKLICDAMGVQHRDHLNHKIRRNKAL